MSSSAFESEGSREPAPDHEPQPESATPPDAAESELLDQVLQETLQLTGEDDPLDPQDLQKLIDVARNSGAETLTEPLVEELVLALICNRYRQALKNEDLLVNMSRQIASTLWDDPVGNELSHRFWRRLMDATLNDSHR